MCMKYMGVDQYKTAAALKIPDGDTLKEIFTSTQQQVITSKHTPTIKEIRSGKYQDIVATEAKSKPTISCDYKRHYSPDGLFSKPLKNVDEAIIIRNDTVSRKKKGKITNLETHSYRKSLREHGCLRSLRNRENDINKECKKMCLRAIAQRVGVFQIALQKFRFDAQIARHLGKKDLKNEKRENFIANLIPATDGTKDVIHTICKALEIEEYEEAVSKLILVTD